MIILEDFPDATDAFLYIYIKKFNERFWKIFLTFYSAKYIGNISGFLPRWFTATTNDFFLHDQLKPREVTYEELLYVQYGTFIFISSIGHNMY